MYNLIQIDIDMFIGKLIWPFFETLYIRARLCSPVYSIKDTKNGAWKSQNKLGVGSIHSNEHA